VLPLSRNGIAVAAQWIRIRVERVGSGGDGLEGRVTESPTCDM
jgi:hypothetical protein